MLFFKKLRGGKRSSQRRSRRGSPADSMPVSDSSLYDRRDSVETAQVTRSPGGTQRLIPRQLATLVGTPLCLVMVGLPARGKSYITQKLVRYLRWRGFTCKEFNAGNKRRELMDGGGQNANFFSGESAARENIAKLTFDDLVDWLKDGGHVAVFDATNTTCNRRSKVIQWCKEANLPAPIFVESICDDEAILEVNYRLKLQNDDYKGMDSQQALEDFKQRVREYEAVYEPVGFGEEGDRVSYIKLYNVGQKVVMNRCYGFLVSQIVTILQNFHIQKRRLFLTRHGESEDNLLGKLGGDSELTDKGHEYAKRLRTFIQDIRSDTSGDGEDNIYGDSDAEENRNRLMIATSMLRRSQDTALPFRELNDRDIHFYHTNQLNEINAGLCEGMTYDQIKKEFPEEYQARQDHKLVYRYPMGESYVDVINRLNPLVLDMERLRHDILVVSHQACIRALMGYFLGTPSEEVPHLEVPLHSVLEIVPGAYKSQVIVHDLFAE